MSGYGQPPPYYEQIRDCKKSPLPPTPPPVGQAAAADKPDLKFPSKRNQIYLSWVPVSHGGQIPPRAIEGRDPAGIFVARAHHGYHLLPGKAARQLRCSHVCQGGVEVVKQDYEVLCDSSMACFGHVAYDWAACDGASVPPGALAGGYTDKGEPLFIARGSVNGDRVFGYLAASQKCASFPWGGVEHHSSDFEVLVLR